MSCYETEPVRLGVKSLKVPRRAGTGAPGEMTQVFRAKATCGWESRSIGTEPQAWGWGRQHALLNHSGKMLPCTPGRHIKSARTGACIKCDTDMLSPAERAKKTQKEFNLGAWE